MKRKFEYTYASWIAAFTIFAKYGDGISLGDICCEHDTIWCGPETDKISDEDKAELVKCGWEIDEDVNRFCQNV